MTTENDTIEVSAEEYAKLKKSYENDHKKYDGLNDAQIDRLIEDNVNNAVLKWIQEEGLAKAQSEKALIDEQRAALLQQTQHMMKTKRAALRSYEPKEKSPLELMLDKMNAEVERITAENDTNKEDE